MKEKIGVYICHCGGNISDYVDVQELSRMLKDEMGVEISKDVMFACADSNQKAMVNDIQEHKLDAIVVASCSPKLHLHTFRNVADRAGLNPSNYVQVNIREQCSWPHSDQPRQATEKALGLIRAGIRRVAQSESLEKIEVPVKRAVLVVGAGVAGMRAALELARSGNDVYLVEKDFFVGGRVAQSNSVFMTEENGKTLIAKLYDEIKKYNNITLFTGAEIEKVSGSFGNFFVDIHIRPRGIKAKYDVSEMNQAMEECPVMLNDDFHFRLGKRKAVYKNYPGALPDYPVAIIDELKDQTAFLEKYKNCIDATQKPETLTVNVGAVMVATGFDLYEPKNGEFGFQEFPGVITLSQFNTLLEQSVDKFVYQGREIRKVAYIYCVGSRQTKGENKYCSRACCSATIHSSLVSKKKHKHITSFHLYRDIRTYGKQEILYQKASEQGDIFIKYEEKEPPQVLYNGKGLSIKVKDYLTSKQELEIDTDLVVLVTGMVSRDDSPEISEKFKIPIGNDKFFNEIHPKLKPVETVIKGVYIGGACQGPKNISESVQSSLAASAKIHAMLSGGSIQLEPNIARVDESLCVWCGKCAEVCEYSAIKPIDVAGKQVAFVNTATCAGCGICAPVCPVNAINLAGFTDNEIEAMIDGFGQEVAIEENPHKQVESSENQSVSMKEYPQIWKQILACIDIEKKTIPEIASQIQQPVELVTWHLMTMNKYGLVIPDGMDKKELYYLYSKAKKSIL